MSSLPSITPTLLNPHQAQPMRSVKSPRTIEVSLAPRKTEAPSQSNYLPDYPPKVRAKILGYLAATSNPFPLSIRNTEDAVPRQDIVDIWELLSIAGENRWWEMSLDDAHCERCVLEKLREPCSMPKFPEKIPFLASIARHLGLSPSNSESQIVECPHDTSFSQLQREIGRESRSRLQCIRLSSRFQNSFKVCSAVHNLIRLFPNIQYAEVILPPREDGPIPEPARAASHMSTLEQSLPKGTGLKIDGLLEHPEFMKEWVRVKRKWHQLVSQDDEQSHFRNLLADEKHTSESSGGITWAV